MPRELRSGTTPGAAGAASPPPAPAPVPQRARSERIAKRKGVNSNYYLSQMLDKGTANLSAGQKRELAVLIKQTHRIKPTANAGDGKSVFNSVTGHHEWLPTDRADHIVHAGDKVWAGFYTNLRSPTWLLVVNPERYCVDRDRYRACIASAGGRAASKSGPSVRASDLGLVGHSGGLSHKGKQLTEFQSAWHDELRDLYDKHAPSNAYDAYWIDLQNFIATTFLFVAAPSLPLGGADVKGASNDDVMKAIVWDLHLSNRGNPSDVPMATMHDVAAYLHREWASWGQYLWNSFRAWRNA
jgi:hypothetical protein